MKATPDCHPRGGQNAKIASLLAALVIISGPAWENAGAQTHQIIHAFWGDPAYGSAPIGRLAQGSDGVLYGATQYGGYALNPYGGFGTVFKVNPDGSGFAVLKQFTGLDGAQPAGGVVLMDNVIYGTTYTGHTSDYSNTVKGTVYRINTDGSGFSVLKSFAGGTDGAGPVGELLLVSNTLYGVTYGNFGAPPAGFGTVFKINTDGSGFATLKTFTYGPDCFPDGGLIMVSNVLYGTGSCFPLSGPTNIYFGSIFRMNPDGTDYRVLITFSGSPYGSGPIGSLVWCGNALYGTTFDGGDLDPDAFGQVGTIFKVNLDGSGFTVLKRLTPDCSQPNGSLVLSGDSLYGTAAVGGNDYGGRVFGIKTDGSGFAAFHTFNITEGFKPICALMLSSNTLYGSTQYGAAGGYAVQGGTIFSLTIPPPEVTVSPLSQSAEVGSATGFRAKTTNTLPPTYQWYFNETNSLGDATTNPALSLLPAGFNHSGAYTVITSNLFGVCTSAPAALSVISPVPRRQVPAINVAGGRITNVALEWTTNCGPEGSWNVLDAADLAGVSPFYFDMTSPRPLLRFYRTRVVIPRPPPVLTLNFAPALTLTGNIGSAQRLDFINAVGPTNAWVTLDTIILTNSSQLYFDVSSINQPRRLYRITNIP